MIQVQALGSREMSGHFFEMILRDESHHGDAVIAAWSGNGAFQRWRHTV